MLTFPEIDPVALQLGPLAIRWYSLAYLAGIALGWAYVVRTLQNPAVWRGTACAVTPADIGDFVLWATLGIILGGRLGYVLFYNFSFFAAHPLEALKLWQGGMSFHGGMLGVILAILLFAWKRRLPLGQLADLVACAAPIGLFFGRIANFINAELWGRVTDSPLGMVFPGAGPAPRHPSQLYEAVLEGVVLFLLLYFVSRRKNGFAKPWLLTGLFLTGYGLSRITVEFFREPDAHIGYLQGGVTMGMLLSVPMVIAGVVLAVFAFRKAADVRGA